MQGPALSAGEIAALLARDIRQLNDLGVPRERAVDEVARRHGIDAGVIVRLIVQHNANVADRRAA